MGNWRKQPGEGHHQVGHWSRSSSYNRKPPLENWQPTVPRWEKMFCTTVGSIPWRKLIETKKYMYLHDNVMNWDDSAGREAFHNAKRRFWAEINGLPCNISLPDPNIYIDDIDWNSSVDPELVLDLEREAKVPSEEEKDEEVVILGSSFLLNQSFSCTGWGEAEADIPTHTDLFSGAQVNLHDNNIVGPWEQYCASDDAAKEYEWQNCSNDYWGWNQWEHYHSDAHRMGKGRAGGNRGTWDGYKRRGENMSWYKPHAYHHGEEYQMNQSFSCSGWGGAEPDIPKHTDLFTGALVNPHENNIVGPWEQYCAPDEAAKEYESQNCRNDSWGWNQREHCHSDAHRMGKGTAGRNRGTWDGYKRNGETMSWYKTPAYHHGEEYQMNRGRRNNRGRRRGTFA